MAGVLLGLFLARFWYELEPVRLAPLGDWPGAILVTIGGVIFLSAQWSIALRRWLAARMAFPVHAPLGLLAIYILWPEVDLRLASIVLLASVGLAAALGLRALSASPYSSSWPRLTPSAMRRLAPLVLGFVVFGIYARTLGTHVGRADTFEFQVVAPTLGVAHPTGYPLFVIIGKLFSLLPIGSMAFRVNLVSAVSASLAALVVFSLVVRLTGRRLVAFLTALAFAVSGVVWSQAVVAEVYALNALIAGTVIFLLVELVSSPASPAAQPGLPSAARAGLRPRPASSALPQPSSKAASDRRASRVVPLLFLLLGLGLSHHLTTILLLPACALAILLARPRLPIRTTLKALGLFGLGLAPWLYIPLRWPALHGGTPMTPAEFIDWITGARFGGALDLSAWSDPTRWQIVGRFVLEAFGAAGAALALIGAIGLARRHPRAALITLITFAAYAFYGAVYLVPDIAVFIIPAYGIMAIWIGVGVALLAEALMRRIAAESVYAVSLAGLLLMPVTLLHQNFTPVDQRGKGEPAELWGRYVLSLPILDGAALLVDSEKIAPLYYLQTTASLRPDLDILVLGTEEEYRRELDTRVAGGQPVYLARFLPNLPYPMRSLGPLVEVRARHVSQATGRQANLPANAQVGQIFGDLFELMSAAVETGEPARVTLEWRALTASRPNYYVRLRLIDMNDRVWWEDAGAHPVSGYYPTGAWTEGEVVSDYHEIGFNPSLPPGAYTVQVGLFPPFREEGLRTADGSTWSSVANLEAPLGTPPPLDRTLRQIYGGRVAVTGVETVGSVPASGLSRLKLNWTPVDQALASVSARLAPGSSSPQPLTARQAALDFRAPDQDGTYPLRLSLVDPAGSPLLAKCGWLAPVSVDCPIGAVQVAGDESAEAVNFDNQVLLTTWSIDRRELRPGETLQLTLNWRGLKKWDADYTVFVHLIGPDGKLHGQTDAWPVQGTLRTSMWEAGQRVVDPYSVTLHADAPGGRYQVEVGWYLLATLRRLPVLDAAGRPSDDRLILDEFDVP